MRRRNVPNTFENPRETKIPLWSPTTSLTLKERVLDPEAWKQTAHHLFSAAALLEPKVDEFQSRLRSGDGESSTWRPWDEEFVAIYFMLCAYAIENLFKSKIIQKNTVQLEEELKSIKVLPKQLKQHDL